MNYLLKSKGKKPQQSIIKIVSILVLTVLIILILSTNFSRNILFKIGRPFWSFSSSIVSFWNNNDGTFRSKKSLIEENASLMSQLQSSKNNLIFLNLVIKENDSLKDLLNRKRKSDNLILASILVKPGLSPYDTLILDAGTNDGITVGKLVMADASSYIGEISEVSDTSSKVKLYSSPGVKINVLVGPNNIEKEAIGIGDGTFKLEIPKEIGVKVGDNVVIPSMNTNIFGIVEKVESKDTDSFQTVLFKSPINIQELKYVEIVLNQSAVRLIKK